MFTNHKIHLNEFVGPISKQRKRVGRGIGSGTGGTAGAGHKGQSSRSGVTTKRRHAEFARRFPKIGFRSNVEKMSFATLRTISEKVAKAQLDTTKPITIADLKNLGLSTKNGLKIIGHDVTIPLHLEANAFSSGAEAAIKAAGGTVVRAN